MAEKLVLAAVMSSLSSPVKGKMPKIDMPAPRAKTPTTTGLGAKMRQETSQSLEKMLKQGSFTTGLEGLVKAARAGAPPPVPTPHAAPAPRPSTSWVDAHRGVAHMQAANVTPYHPELPAPPTAVQALGGGGGNAGGFQARGPAPMPPQGPGQPQAAPARGGRMGRTMGLLGLGAAGAAMYGMHQQHEEDQRRRSLVYSPLPGSVMQ